MLLVPRKNHSISLFDEMFNDPFFRDPFFTTSLQSFGGNSMMKTDISEKNGEYRFEIDLPGCSKEDIKASFHNGLLKITVPKEVQKIEEKKTITIS